MVLQCVDRSRSSMCWWNVLSILWMSWWWMCGVRYPRRRGRLLLLWASACARVRPEIVEVVGEVPVVWLVGVVAAEKNCVIVV